ncbi:MAG: hypothetical protein ACYTFY_13330 [Planctomycetota bacterium]|jgi:hypothetical protein
MTDQQQTEKYCYCDEFDDDYRKAHGIPEGYCGICEVCGAPGHTQHFPGARPYTGAWCDDCLEHVAKNYKVQSAVISIVMLGILAGIGYGVYRVVAWIF